MENEELCKIECGGWATYQGNEYLSLFRSLINPLTVKYILHIASTFRERSAVHFLQQYPGQQD